jgi:hypothetical protein
MTREIVVVVRALAIALLFLAAIVDAAIASTALPELRCAVIVPGFLSGNSDFAPLAKELSDRGIPTVVVPMPAWHWLPCLGGRSMRPMLERIDHTVKHLAATGDPATVPPFQYSLLDCFLDFRTTPGGVSSFLNPLPVLF